MQPIEIAKRNLPDINDYTKEPCVYLIHIVDSDYKFGVSGEIEIRYSVHIKTFTGLGFTPKLINVWKCETMEIMKETEMKIKLLAKQNNIFVPKYNQKEIIVTDDVNYVVNRIDHYVETQNARERNILKLRTMEIRLGLINATNESKRIELELINCMKGLSIADNNVATNRQLIDLTRDNNVAEVISQCDVAVPGDISVPDYTVGQVIDLTNQLSVLTEQVIDLTGQLSCLNEHGNDKINRVIDVTDHSEHACIIMTERDRKKEIARVWVCNNRPMRNETTTSYYKRYSQDVKHYLHSNYFGPVVKGVMRASPVQGSDGTRHW